MRLRIFTKQCVAVAAIVVGVGLGAPAAAFAAGPAAASAPVTVNVDSTVESYCGGTGTIKDVSRNMSFFMVHNGSTFHQGYWIKHYEARYLDGRHFKFTDNRC